MGQQDKARDKEILREFASVTGLALCPGQLDTPDPPQPDLVAMIEGAGRVAYELGEIVDQDLARNYSLSARTFVAIREYHEAMPPEIRTAFDTQFANSDITFRFSDRADLRKRRLALPAIFDALFDAGIPEKGRLQLVGAHIEDVLKSVYILVTAAGAGPSFGAPHASCFDPSPLPILKKKLKKAYETHHPLELILHSGQRSLYAEEAWLPTVSAHVEEKLGHSPFRRIWIFERHPPRVVYVYPKPKHSE